MLNYKENKVGLIVNGTGNAEKIIALLEKSLNASGVKEPEVNVVYAGGDGAKIEELLASRNNPVQQQNELKEQQAYIDTVLAGKTAVLLTTLAMGGHVHVGLDGGVSARGLRRKWSA